MTTRGWVRQAGGPAGYAEWLRVPDLSAGIYVLPAGGVDRQQPHSEDEVYVVVSGRAALEIDGEAHPVSPGSVAFVAAGVQHRFVDIVEELTVAVVFGPAEGSRAAAPDGGAPSTVEA